MTRLVLKREPQAPPQGAAGGSGQAGSAGGGQRLVRSGGSVEEGGTSDRLAQPGSACAGEDFSGREAYREAGSCLEIDFGMSPAARGALAGASRRRPEQQADQDLPLFVAEGRRPPWKNGGGGGGSRGGHEQAGECVAACGVAAALRRDDPGQGSFVAKSARGGDVVGASRGLHGGGRESGAGVRSSNNMDGMHDLEGYNSADEYYDDSRGKDAEDLILKEQKFEKDLWKERGFVVRRCEQDGNCLFRAVSDQVYGDQGMHDEVRERCLNYISAERDHFGHFITEEFDDYVQRKRKDKVFGNNLEMQAISEMYNRPIEVYSYSTDATTVLQKDSKMPPIRLSYHSGCHYNSVVDPKARHIGLGLGLPESKATGGIRGEDDNLEGEGDLDDEEVTRRILVQQARDLEQQDLEEALVKSTIEASIIGWEEEGHHLNLQFEQMCLEQTMTCCEMMAGNEGDGDELASAGAAFGTPRGG